MVVAAGYRIYIFDIVTCIFIHYMYIRVDGDRSAPRGNDAAVSYDSNPPPPPRTRETWPLKIMDQN